MSWNCNNSCNIITTHIAEQIIASYSPPYHLQQIYVQHVDVDGRLFNISDAPCLKIVIDLNDEQGGRVLQKIGRLIEPLQLLRNDFYSSDVLQQLRCAALCPAPFNLQLSSDVELIVCAGCIDTCPKPTDYSARYLMMIAFLLGLLTLLYFFSLLCYFWRQWFGGCNLCCASCQHQQPQTCGACGIIASPQPAATPVFDQSFLNQVSPSASSTLGDLLNKTSDVTPAKTKA